MNRKIAILSALLVIALLAAPALSWGAKVYGGTSTALDQSLFFALARGDLGSIAALRDKGGNINGTCLEADLDPARTFGPLADVVLKTDADLDNWPLLFWAVYLQNKDAVRVLLRSGAYVNIQDPTGTTALHWACWTGNYPIVRELLANGANANVVDSSGRTPLDWALLTAQEDVIRILPPDTGGLDSDGDGVPDRADQCPDTPKGATVDERGCWIVAYATFFDTDKSIIKQQYLPHIKQAANVLQAYPHINVIIAGHADHRASDAYNLALAQRRADSVKSKLVEYGVDPARLTTKSYGESQPIATNSTAAGMAKNRRVEIQVRETNKAGN